MDMYGALRAAQMIQGRPDAAAFAQDLCAVRGQDPWQPVHVAGFGVQRWIATIAELIMLGRIAP